MLWNTLEWQPENKSTIEFFLLLRLTASRVCCIQRVESCVRSVCVCACVRAQHLVFHSTGESKCICAATSSVYARRYYNFLIPAANTVDRRLSVSSFVAVQIIITIIFICHSHRTVKWIWYRDETSWYLFLSKRRSQLFHDDYTERERDRRTHKHHTRQADRNAFNLCSWRCWSSLHDRPSSTRFVCSLGRMRTHTLAQHHLRATSMPLRTLSASAYIVRSVSECVSDRRSCRTVLLWFVELAFHLVEKILCDRLDVYGVRPAVRILFIAYGFHLSVRFSYVISIGNSLFRNFLCCLAPIDCWCFSVLFFVAKLSPDRFLIWDSIHRLGCENWEVALKKDKNESWTIVTVACDFAKLLCWFQRTFEAKLKIKIK